MCWLSFTSFPIALGEQFHESDQHLLQIILVQLFPFPSLITHGPSASGFPHPETLLPLSLLRPAPSLPSKVRITVSAQRHDSLLNFNIHSVKIRWRTSQTQNSHAR